MSERSYKVTKQPDFLGKGWNLHLYQDGHLVHSYFYELFIGSEQCLYGRKSKDWSFLAAWGEGLDFVNRNWLPVNHSRSVEVA